MSTGRTGTWVLETGSNISFQFDAEKVALELGYKNGTSLRARWNSLKRSKITSGSSAPAGGVDKTTPSKKANATPKKATPKKAKSTETEDGDGSESVAGKKAGKKVGKKGKADVKVEDDDDDAVDGAEGSNGVSDLIDWGS